MTADKRTFEGPIADWIKERTAAIREAVRVADVLSENGVPLRYGGSRSEQIFCPFHPNSKSMAAKYHADGDDDHGAGVYCFVCQKRWDVVGVWREFQGMQAAKFTAVLRAMERAYNLCPPEIPSMEGYEVWDKPGEEEEARLTALLAACERRLVVGRESFDRKGYLTLGVVLDRLRARMNAGTTSPAEAKAALERVLRKIGEKCRAS